MGVAVLNEILVKWENFRPWEVREFPLGRGCFRFS